MTDIDSRENERVLADGVAAPHKRWSAPRVIVSVNAHRDIAFTAKFSPLNPDYTLNGNHYGS